MQVLQLVNVASLDGCESKQFDAEKNIKHWMDIANGVRYTQWHKD